MSTLEDADKAKNILTYHVVPEKLVASNLRKEKSFTGMRGTMLKIEEHRWLRRGIKVNDALVKETDLEGTNGDIHIIDTILVPKYRAFTIPAGANGPEGIGKIPHWSSTS